MEEPTDLKSNTRSTGSERNTRRRKCRKKHFHGLNPPTRKLLTHITWSDASFETILTTPKPPWDGGKEAEDRLSHSLLLFHTKAKTDLVILGARSELTGTVEPKYQKRLIPSIHTTDARPRYDNLRCCEERKTLSSALSAGSQS